MTGPGSVLTVEERLEKARLLSRVNHEVLTMCKTVDQLLHAQHTSNLAQAIVCVQELARENYPVVIALKWVVLLVDLLESDVPDVRLASCNAIAAVSMVQEGRDVVRSSGGLRPLVMLLAEGSRSPVAAAAAWALMNCSACDTCKASVVVVWVLWEAIAECRGVPMLLGLVRQAASRCNPAAANGGGSGAGGSGGLGGGGNGTQGSNSNTDSLRGGGGGGGGGGSGPSQDLRSPGDCKAAVYAAGALMNLGGVISVQELLVEAGAVQVFEAVMRLSLPGDVLATRANFMLSWLAVATSAVMGTLEPRPSELDSSPPPSVTPRTLAPASSTNSSYPAHAPSVRPSATGGGGGGSSVQQPLPTIVRPSASSGISGAPPHQPSVLRPLATVNGNGSSGGTGIQQQLPSVRPSAAGSPAGGGGGGGGGAQQPLLNHPSQIRIPSN
ncbi:hypothetical protein VOLCADRAFT_118256 [Volvox carteri f. nagariensis]|uniref:Uncharacterized protein n=1 Tax=Volvox carteri f. nagariensis TaxID=3068 RepID=D8U318_VOLCA|nr:uncharacterized protein VOLCADRAFT_118256 [Volvox carteri f. nagariensis]EFJ45999.1 hypothetical protein VOLCADRAFT_118256 [Volvox carteri f. nagariensis]|eukprot:XP_002953077.1 hypothetical protein VOLCADRAFT_118256 [Volvox carteri f. nagariensis]